MAKEEKEMQEIIESLSPNERKILPYLEKSKKFPHDKELILVNYVNTNRYFPLTFFSILHTRL